MVRFDLFQVTKYCCCMWIY